MPGKQSFGFRDPGVLRDGELELVLMKKKPADPAKGFVPVYSFRMRRDSSEEAVGHITLRVGDAAAHPGLFYGGSVGYGVTEAARGNRYAARAVALLLPLARAHGMSELWITCTPDNTASRKTCEIAGAELVEVVPLPEDNEQYKRGDREKCRYRIQL